MSNKAQELAGFTRPSDVAAGKAQAAPAGPAAQQPRAGLEAPVRPELPPCMKVAFRGGELVELTKDQHYADLVVVRAGEKGKTICPSSQAAHWVVLFPRIGPETRVVPEWRLRRVGAAPHH